MSLLISKNSWKSVKSVVNLLPLVYLLFACSVLYFGVQITRWVNADLSFKQFNLFLSIVIFILGIQLIFRTMRWPGASITLLLAYLAYILLGIKYITNK